jgi:hypothetical protein
MSRLKPKALSNPPSQTTLEAGLDSAHHLIPNTVARLRQPLVALTEGAEGNMTGAV